MSKVTTGLTASLDGSIAGPNDGDLGKPLGEGGMRLFEWHASGDTRYEWPGNDIVSNVSAASARLLDEAMSATGAQVTGRRTFDIANGWNGKHPAGGQIFVATHTIPEE